MEWFKKHADTVVILSAVLSCTLWINHQLNSVDKRLTIIETVLIMKDIMPKDLPRCVSMDENGIEKTTCRKD